MDSINSTFGIGRLIAKHLTNALDAAEEQQLDTWLKADEKHAAIFNRIVQYESLGAALAEMQQINTELALQNVKARIGGHTTPEPVTKTAKLWPRIAGIAAAVIGIALCVWLYRSNLILTPDRHPELVSGSQDIAPGKNTATLTVNGNTLNLSEAKTGVAIDATKLTYNDGTKIDPSALGLNNPSSRANAKDLTLEVTTPRGGTYSIILQDGTKVWLNADSKLEFLSNYRNKVQRIVKLIAGEAYFEVAKNKAKPFIVECNGQRTEVLGTHFNISAYSDDTGIKTTLLEGSVRVSLSNLTHLSSRANAKVLDPSEVGMTKREAVILKPNQQSLVTASAGITVKEVDASAAIAWKEGYFKFDNEPLASIMLKISRWYNVEVVYQDQQLKSTAFGGTVSRFGNVSQILNKLQLTGKAHFKIEGQKIIVTK